MEITYWFKFDSDRAFNVVLRLMDEVTEGIFGYSEGMDIHWFKVA
jgi:hypothetical protein